MIPSGARQNYHLFTLEIITEWIHCKSGPNVVLSLSKELFQWQNDVIYFGFFIVEKPKHRRWFG